MNDANDIRLRPITADDRALLFRIYASTRAEELARTGWPEAEITRFLEHQFHAQHTHYQAAYPDGMFAIVESAGVPVGRLYVHRRPDEIRIVDIALLPEHRGKGLGSKLLGAILDEAATHRAKTSIHVEQSNPARKLYERLGFRVAGENGVYFLMEREAG